MRYLTFLLTFFIASVSFAQSEGLTGFTFGVQTGFEYISYLESYVNTDSLPAKLQGSSTAFVGTFSVEYDLSAQHDVPLFIALSAGIPLKTFKGEERGTFTEFQQEYITQTNDVEHHYSMFRGFLGYKLKPEFSPFVIFERSLFESIRSKLMVGTDSGVLVPGDTGITWRERVWSSHFGAGFQGGIPLDDAKEFYIRYRAAVLLPSAVFVTNDRPEVFNQSDKLGSGTGGITFLGRVAAHYNWHPRSSVQLGVNLYTRSWDGDGEIHNAYWPANDMEAIPVLLGFTWSI